VVAAMAWSAMNLFRYDGPKMENFDLAADCHTGSRQLLHKRALPEFVGTLVFKLRHHHLFRNDLR
jgi:hypothetical protein